MKKLLVALLALVSLAVVAAGCGGGDKKADNGADKKVTLKVGRYRCTARRNPQPDQRHSG